MNDSEWMEAFETELRRLEPLGVSPQTLARTEQRLDTLRARRRPRRFALVGAAAAACVAIAAVAWWLLPRSPAPDQQVAVATRGGPKAAAGRPAPVEDVIGRLPVKLAIRASTDFAMDLYHQLAKENAGRNLFFSPYSVSVALMMTAEGARGQTALEMGDVLCLPDAARRVGDDQQRIPWRTALIHTGLSELSERFNRPNKPYRLSIANAIWGDKGYSFRQTYIDTISNAYGTGGLKPADFQNNPEAERQRINGWIEEQTENRIRNLLKEGKIKRDTVLVLTDAIYFSGDWTVPFDKERTRQSPFARDDGKKVNVPMMYQACKAPFATVPLTKQGGVNVQLLDLPYAGEELSMFLIMPDKPGYLPTLEKSLSSENLRAWTERLKPQTCAVYLPRFKVETNYDLAESLSAMGMPTALSPAADFSGMAAEASKLSISDVLHKAFVEVDEEGTEAAAGTAVIMKRGGHPVFRANRPFLFLIRDRATGVVLLFGRVMDPSTAG